MPQTASNKNGFSYIYVILVVVFLALFLVNGLRSVVNQDELIYGPSPTPTSRPLIALSGACCDLGNGDQCKPQTDTDKKFTFNGQEYGLLKTGVKFSEGFYHLEDSGEKFNNNPIIVNTTDGYLPLAHPGYCQGGDSLTGPGGCISIPNDLIVYVCKDKCHVTTNDARGFCAADPSQVNKAVNRRIMASCYGDADSVYDAYFKLSDYPSPGVPDVIKQCSDPNANTVQAAPGKQMIEYPPNTTAEQNLQLRTFKIVDIPPITGSTAWVSPWCKPAIYLYPIQKTDVSVKVTPVGNMTLTIPKYPLGGWQVTAFPNGQIEDFGQTFNYLYYEAQIPDEKIDRPNKGFVRKASDLKTLLTEILPKLGLNDNESSEFISYWMKSLPKAPYFFVGVVPQGNLEQIAPLEITPQPNKIIRITIYFQALDQPITVEEPKIETPERAGFTVVEWGGIFKKDPKYPFSCFM